MKIEENYQEYLDTIIEEIIDAEKEEKEGKEKKERVIQNVEKLAMKKSGVLHVLKIVGKKVLPIFSGAVVNIVVGILNKYLGKDWIKIFKKKEDDEE